LGRIFKTPTDDSTEATLRAMHTQNTLDNYYEKGWGWLRTFLFTFIAILGTSLWEKNTDVSVWDNTIEWFVMKIEAFGNWLLELF
jgi:hypothetical protein|tara:strand:+ start:2709 stop:2963 length:255 start_codon:yes stop_codon:yes gene_type:complete